MGAHGDRPGSRLMVFVFTDLVGSVQLKRRHGEVEAVRMIARHDELFKQTIAAVPDGEILKDTGDGFLASFTTTSAAVKTALRFQRLMHAEPWSKEPLRVRIGVHLGGVSELAPETTGLAKISGLAVDICARIMHLAKPGQILMTRAVHDDARHFVREQPPVDGADTSAELVWMIHGPYVFKGIDEPMEICEVGAHDIAPLKPPHGLGWRPEVGQPIAIKPRWELERKLGEGGFGEVWLARHVDTKEARVFKFCFDTESLRGLKRELALFKLLREALGDRPDIAKIYDIQLDEPPYYLESEFTEYGDLVTWLASQGGIDQIPPAIRLDLFARACEAVAAAHSVGILHKDLKPSNILIYSGDDGEPRPRLCDFGIGMLTDMSQLERFAITVTSSTMLAGGTDSDQAITRMYAPPEIQRGEPFTVRGDVFALGVMLYQLVVGDLRRPLVPGWEEDVADELLRQDIKEATARNPEDRLQSAGQLAHRVRTLRPRRAAYRKEQRRRRLMQAAVVTAVAFLFVGGLSAGLWFRERGLRESAERSRAVATASRDFLVNTIESVSPHDRGPGVKMLDVLKAGVDRIKTEFATQPEVRIQLYETYGKVYRAMNLYIESTEYFNLALALANEHLPRDDATQARLMGWVTRNARDTGIDKPDDSGEADENDELVRAESYIDKSHHLHNFGAYDMAEFHLRAALKLYESAKEEPGIAKARDRLGRVAIDRGDLQLARACLNLALPMKNRLMGPGSPDLGFTLLTVGYLQHASQQWDAALDSYWQSRIEYEQAHAVEPKFLVKIARMDLEGALVDAAALGMQTEFSKDAIHDMSLCNQRFVAAISLRNRGRLLHRFGAPQEGDALFQRSLDIDERIERECNKGRSGSIAHTQRVWAELLLEAGDLDRAMERFQRALEIQRSFGGETEAAIVPTLLGLTRLLLMLGRTEEALRYANEAMQVQETLQPAGAWPIAVCQLARARCLTAMGQHEQAEVIAASAVDTLQRDLGAESQRSQAAARTLEDLRWKKSTG